MNGNLKFQRDVRPSADYSREAFKLFIGAMLNSRQVSIFWLLAMIGVGSATGCNRSSNQKQAKMSAEQILRSYRDKPPGESIEPVSAALARQSIFVATDASATTEPSEVVLEKLRFLTANDNQGRAWAYAYTSKDELIRAFPNGSPYVVLKFSDFFEVIERDPKFAGMFLNGGSDSSYAIPREVFDAIARVLRRSPDGR